MQKYTFGAKPRKKDIREYKVNRTPISKMIKIPEEFELSMPSVKYQSAVGSCVAHAISTVVEYYNQLQEENSIVFSTGYIYGNRKNSSYKGVGMYVDDAINAVVKWGDVPNDKFDYNIEVPEAINKFEEKAFDLAPDAYPNRFTSFFHLETEQDIKLNLLQNGPIVFSIPWYTDYKVTQPNYVLQHESLSISGYHAMVIYGWNKYGWKIQNSWGSYFGRGGRAILPFDTRFDTCFGIKDEISEHVNQKKLKELEDSNSKYYSLVLEKEQIIADLIAQLTQTQGDKDKKDKQLKAAKEELEVLKSDYKKEIDLNGNTTEVARSLKVAIDKKEAEVLFLENDITSILMKITDLNGDLLAATDQLEYNHKVIKQQQDDITLLKNELLEIKKPFSKMPKWLVTIINAILNIFNMI